MRVTHDWRNDSSNIQWSLTLDQQALFVTSLFHWICTYRFEYAYYCQPQEMVQPMCPCGLEQTDEPGKEIQHIGYILDYTNLVPRLFPLRS